MGKAEQSLSLSGGTEGRALPRDAWLLASIMSQQTPEPALVDKLSLLRAGFLNGQGDRLCQFYSTDFQEEDP